MRKSWIIICVGVLGGKLRQGERSGSLVWRILEVVLKSDSSPLLPGICLVMVKAMCNILFISESPLTRLEEGSLVKSAWYTSVRPNPQIYVKAGHTEWASVMPALLMEDGRWKQNSWKLTSQLSWCTQRKNKKLCCKHVGRQGLTPKVIFWSPFMYYFTLMPVFTYVIGCMHTHTLYTCTQK